MSSFADRLLLDLLLWVALLGSALQVLRCRFCAAGSALQVLAGVAAGSQTTGSQLLAGLVFAV